MSPNKPGLVFEPGVAKLLRAGHDIILQMHYTTNGTAAVDRTQIGFIFAKEPPKQIHVTGLAVQPRFVIPAGDPNAEVKAVAEIRQDTVLTSLTPHMHVRGKDMTYTALYPDGTSEVLLRVPKYDFNFQITYDLAKPKILPKGTKVEVVAHFDNSPGQQVQPRPHEGREMGRPDVGRDDDRVLGFSRRRAGGVSTTKTVIVSAGRRPGTFSGGPAAEVRRTRDSWSGWCLRSSAWVTTDRDPISTRGNERTRRPQNTVCPLGRPLH